MIVFTQEEFNGDLKLRTDQGMDITFKMENGTCEEIWIDNGEAVFGANDDNLHALFAMTFKQVHSIASLVSMANVQYDDINEETRRFAQDEDDMGEELSSPFLTGRV